MEQDISQAIRNAMQALERGDKTAAQLWAQRAASLAPHLEQPWLILGAASDPADSIAYLENALEINPDSVAAKKGLIWARKRLAEKKSQLSEPIQSQPVAIKNIPVAPVQTTRDLQPVNLQPVNFQPLQPTLPQPRRHKSWYPCRVGQRFLKGHRHQPQLRVS